MSDLHHLHDARALPVRGVEELDKAEFPALGDGRDATVHVELVENVLNVIAYRGWTEAHVQGYVRRTPALGEKCQCFIFSAC